VTLTCAAVEGKQKSMAFVGRNLVSALMPPVLMSAARAFKRKIAPAKPVWEKVPGGWEAVRRNADVRGWNVRTAVDASAIRAQNLVISNLADRLPFGLTSATVDMPTSSLEFHNTAESFVHAFLSSTRNLRRASVMDWGGGVGHYSEICRAVAPDLDLDYHCRELPEFVRRGRELFPTVTFYEDESWRSRTYDFVFSSSSLQYVENWQSQLRALAEAAAGARLFVTRIPIIFRSPAYVFIQRPHAWGFDTEYAAWCFNRTEFLSTAAQIGLRPAWEFVTGERIEVTGASELGEYRGFLFDVPARLK
jgi:putative methyltransferase (TIGR04325 family)